MAVCGPFLVFVAVKIISLWKQIHQKSFVVVFVRWSKRKKTSSFNYYFFECFSSFGFNETINWMFSPLNNYSCKICHLKGVYEKKNSNNALIAFFVFLLKRWRQYFIGKLFGKRIINHYVVVMTKRLFLGTNAVSSFFPNSYFHFSVFLSVFLSFCSPVYFFACQVLVLHYPLGNRNLCLEDI
jgi:hypothetical protein